MKALFTILLLSSVLVVVSCKKGSSPTPSTTGTIPTITNFTPKGAVGGQTVTITGTNFDPIAANNVIMLLFPTVNGSVTTSVINATSTTLTFVVPSAAVNLINSGSAYGTKPYQLGISVDNVNSPNVLLYSADDFLNVFTINTNDYLQARAFLMQPSANPSISNGQAAYSLFDPDSPSTWLPFGFTNNRLSIISAIYISANFSAKLAGSLVLKGCTGLNNIGLDNNALTSIDLTGGAPYAGFQQSGLFLFGFPGNNVTNITLSSSQGWNSTNGSALSISNTQTGGTTATVTIVP